MYVMMLCVSAMGLAYLELMFCFSYLLEIQVFFFPVECKIFRRGLSQGAEVLFSFEGLVLIAETLALVPSEVRSCPQSALASCLVCS